MKLRARGLTILELMVSLVMFTIVLAALSQAIMTAYNFDTRVRKGRAVRQRDADFEESFRRYLRSAFVSPVPGDQQTFFIGGDAATDLIPAGNGSSLVFSGIPERVSGELLFSQDDFQTINQRIGPVAGLAETAFSTTPSGEAPVDRGLFVRTQHPPDSDQSQGGFESVLDTDIDFINFEFFDGANWVTSWDTRTQTTKRLPAATRVTYRRLNDDIDHIFIVRHSISDVTPDNPFTETGGATQ